MKFLKNILILCIIIFFITMLIFYLSIILIPIAFILKSESIKINDDSNSNIFIEEELINDPDIELNEKIEIQVEKDKILTTIGNTTNNCSLSFQDKVMNYLENLKIEECQSCLSKMMKLQSEGFDTIIIGDEFDIVALDGLILFQVPENFEKDVDCRVKMIKNVLIFEMHISKKISVEEKLFFAPLVKKIAEKLAGQKNLVKHYDPILCV